MNGRHIGRVLVWLATCAVALGFRGCGGDAAVGPTVVVGPAGTLVVDWTVAGTKLPSACGQFGARTLEISISTVRGLDAGTYAQACEAFATSITLAPDDYVANALLVDGAGNARTTVIAIEPFSIFGRGQLTIPIDFPVDSFY